MNAKVEKTRARLLKYAKEAGKSIVTIAKKPKIIDSEPRLIICRKCKHYSNLFCGQCGCFMAIKTKFEAVSCPIGKW